MTKRSLPDGEGGFIEVTEDDGKPDYNWRTDPPTEPGWYWTANGNAYVEVVEVRKSRRSNHLVVISYSEEVPVTQGYSRWLGPLPVPEMPQW